VQRLIEDRVDINSQTVKVYMLVYDDDIIQCITVTLCAG